MLFTIGQSEVYLISPDTKKIALQKNFKEISFCSQVNGHGLSAQLQLNFLMNYFTVCHSTEVAKVTRCMLSAGFVILHFLLYIKAKYNFEVKNFAFSNHNLLEKVGLLFFFSQSLVVVHSHHFQVYVRVCVSICIFIYTFIHTNVFFKVLIFTL